MLFFGVFGAVCAGLVSFAHFAAGFFSVAGFAEGLEVVEVVAPAAGNIFDVVNFEALGVAALDALVVVSV